MDTIGEGGRDNEGLQHLVGLLRCAARPWPTAPELDADGNALTFAALVQARGPAELPGAALRAYKAARIRQRREEIEPALAFEAKQCPAAIAQPATRVSFWT